MADANPDGNLTVLSGTSLVSPAIVGNSLSGNLIVWADSNNDGQITMAISQSSVPYAPQALNPAWSSAHAPAAVLDYDEQRVFVAWTDKQGQVWLADSGDGWQTAMAINGATSSAGPALAFFNDTVFLAWRNQESQLAVFSRDQAGNEKFYPSGPKILSRPALATDETVLFALSGGAEDGSGDQTLLAFRSTDYGKQFQPFQIQQIECLGPPAMAATRINFFLAWADGKSRKLCSTVTNNLWSFSFTTHDEGCEGGGPTLAVLFNPDNGQDDPCAGLSIDPSPSDPNSRHVAILALPPVAGVPGQPSLLAEKHGRRLNTVRAPNPCPPLTIWNPAEGKCVPRGGCWGGCVIQSFNLVFGYPVFNPFKYALCVIGCKKS